MGTISCSYELKHGSFLCVYRRQSLDSFRITFRTLYRIIDETKPPSPFCSVSWSAFCTLTYNMYMCMGKKYLCYIYYFYLQELFITCKFVSVFVCATFQDVPNFELSDIAGFLLIAACNIFLEADKSAFLTTIR